MIELNELDKEYIALCVKGVSEDRLQDATERCIDHIKERGSIQAKGTDYRGFPTFTFKNGFTSTIAPRRYRFNGPLIPEGMDIKQFEAKQ